MPKKDKIVKFHRNANINIGVIIFSIIILYVLFNIFSYLTSSPIAEYEVSQGTIATNNVFRGLILRDETIEYAGQDGYINYYIKNGARVSVKDTIYSIDTTGNISKKISTAVEDGTALGDSEIQEVLSEIDGIMNSYNNVHFSSVYSYKNQLQSELSQTLSMTALKTLRTQVDSAQAKNTFYKVSSSGTGIILYSIDGYEQITTENFVASNFDMVNYSRTNLESNTQVKTLDPVYKRINSENWNILLPVSDDLAKEMKEGTNIKVRFCKDDYTTVVPYTIIKKDGNFYMNLEFQTAMIRYINERFVDIELIINEESGLKIPNSAITSKEFFTIPKKCFTTGGDSDHLSLLVQNKDNNDVTLVTPTIYYESEKAYYVDNEDVSEGDKIVLSDSSKTYMIGKDKDSLVGVYNINKGYAVFKQINIISQNQEYSIIETKTAYGLSLYDHIALAGSKIKENETVFK